MNINRERQAGNLILVVVLVLVVVGFVGVIGWQLYSRTVQTTNPGSTTAGQQPSSQQTDKYAGWQTFCSSTGGLCFRYPADWQKTETAGADPASTTVTIASPSNAVAVVYTPVVVGVGGHCNPNTCFFTAASITPLSSSQAAGLSVVKGVYTNNGTGAILADYFLDSTDKLAPYNLKVNQRVDVGFFADLFTSPLNSAALEELRVKSVPDNGFASEAEASAWLAKPEVVTAGNILSSVYLNKTNQ